MTTTLTVRPDADVTGEWERDQPTPIDATSYVEPVLVGWDAAGYLSEDADSDAFVNEALWLPDIGVSGGGSIQFIGANTYDGSSTFSTVHQIPLPGVSILAGDLIEILVYLAESTAPSGNPTSPGYTLRSSHEDGVSFRPQVYKIYKIATGGESGNVAVTISGNHRCTGASIVWRGVDQVAPYDAASTSAQFGNGDPNPPSIGHPTNGAVTVTYAAGNIAGGTSVTPPTGYTNNAVDMSALDRSWVVDYRFVGDSDTDPEDPAAYDWNVDNHTVFTDALKPGTAVDLTAVIIAAVTDGTTTAELGGGSVPTLDGGGVTFTLDGSFQIPRSDTWRPQVHVWSANFTTYNAGTHIDITVADHDTLQSWAAVLLIFRGLDSAGEIEVLGGEQTGDSSLASFGSVTPLTVGAKIISILAKAPNGSFYSAIGNETPLPTGPSGFDILAQALGDSIVLDTRLSPPLSTVATSPGSASWASNEDWTTGLLVLKPDAAAAASANLYAVVDSDSTDDYIEFGAVAGNMDEVLELDLDALPSTAVITSIALEIEHECSVQNQLRVELVAIGAGDTLTYGGELQAGYFPTSLSEISRISTGAWYRLADGSALNDHTRFGVRLFSTQREPTLSSHKIYNVTATVTFEEGGPVASSVVGPDATGDPVTWEYSSPSGLPQTHYQVMLINGSSQDPTTATEPDNPLETVAGEIIYDSGRIPSTSARSLTISDDPIGNGANTAAVRVWTRIGSGLLVASDWATDNYNVSGSGPIVGNQNNNGFPALNAATGGVDVTINVTTTPRAWLLRSEDSGATYRVTKGSPFTVATGGVRTITDYYCPLHRTGIRYQVAFDNGSVTETSIPVFVGTTAADISTLIDRWYMINPTTPSLNFSPDIVADSLRRETQQRSVTVQQPGNGLSVRSPSLGDVFTFDVRCRGMADRVALEAILDAGEFRLVNILGQEWNVRADGGLIPELQRWSLVAGETTQISDSHIYTVRLVEVAEST